MQESIEEDKIQLELPQHSATVNIVEQFDFGLHSISILFIKTTLLNE